MNQVVFSYISLKRVAKTHVGVVAAREGRGHREVRSTDACAKAFVRQPNKILILGKKLEKV